MELEENVKNRENSSVFKDNIDRSELKVIGSEHNGYWLARKVSEHGSAYIPFEIDWYKYIIGER